MPLRPLKHPKPDPAIGRWFEFPPGDTALLPANYLQSQVIARRVRQVLFHTQMLLGRLDGLVPERELYLVDCGPALVGQLGERAAQVVRSYALLLQLSDVADDGVVARLRRDDFAETPPRPALTPAPLPPRQLPLPYPAHLLTFYLPCGFRKRN